LTRILEKRIIRRRASEVFKKKKARLNQAKCGEIACLIFATRWVVGVADFVSSFADFST
jgi:hypothetical protein